MEGTIKKEFQEVIYHLEEMKEEEGVNIPAIGYAIEQLKRLGSTVILDKDAAEFTALTERMCETFIRKNHDYGNSFDKSLDKYGLVAAIVRMGDKFNRLESLLTKGPEVNESIEDTLMDLANYSVMTVKWLKSCTN